MSDVNYTRSGSTVKLSDAMGMKLALFPLRVVLFPGMQLPLHIFEPRYQRMIDLCLRESQPFGVALLRTGAEVGGPADPHPIGTYALISRVERLPGGRMNIEAVGQERFRILDLHHDQPYLTGTVQNFPLLGGDLAEAGRSARALIPWLTRYLALLGEAVKSSLEARRLPDDPLAVAYLAAIIAQIPAEEKQALLAMSSVVEMLEHERTILRREVSLVRAMLQEGQSPDNRPPFSQN
jgi:Lon protease-like protein